MKLNGFQVFKYRNIWDSGWIDVNDVTAFVGQNEAGKSNLFEALFRLNPYVKAAPYNLDEDWPVDDWASKDQGKNAIVCKAHFSLNKDEIAELYEYTAIEGQNKESETEEVEKTELPETLILEGRSYYQGTPHFLALGIGDDVLDSKKVQEWALKNVPKFVYIYDYNLSGARVELDQLQQRLQQHGWSALNNEDQTILIILELAKIDLNEFITKGQTAEGRTTRSFDKRAASLYLSQQFRSLWRQKDVKFEIEIDGPTLNIFVEDLGMGMPVRLDKRSTGFRWYVSFAWKFTHASSGQYKNCILLLEEPGVHLHYEGQRDLIDVFNNLCENNTILYTTHLASMVNLGYPERVRIVESKDKHAVVKTGVVSSQKTAAAVIELSLGLSGDMSGLLGNRQTLIVEGGDDAVVLQKLSALVNASGKEGLSDKIYIWAAKGAPQTPMYAAFVIGNKWSAGVLLDSDEAGNKAKKKIDELYLSKMAADEKRKFPLMQIGKAAGISKTDAAIEDIFPDNFYIECVNKAYGIAIKEEDLPQDGSDMITKRVESVIIDKHGYKELDKRRVMAQMFKEFDSWKSLSDLPKGTAAKVEKLFKTINAAFGNMDEITKAKVD